MLIYSYILLSPLRVENDFEPSLNTMPSLIGHFSAGAVAALEHVGPGLVEAVVGAELLCVGVHVRQVESGGRLADAGARVARDEGDLAAGPPLVVGEGRRVPDGADHAEVPGGGREGEVVARRAVDRTLEDHRPHVVRDRRGKEFDRWRQKCSWGGDQVLFST